MVETNQKFNQYIVKDGLKPESWQLRHNNVWVFEKGKRRMLRYCKEEPSIFKDEQNKDSETTFIWFTFGSLLVRQDDITLNKYIQAHNDFNIKFYLYNEQELAENELKLMNQEDEIRTMLKELNQEQLEAVATVLYGLNVVARWTPDKIKVECFHYLKSNPKRLKEVIKDPATELIYLVSAAIKLDIIKITSDKTAIVWADSEEEIIPIPRGINPLTEMSQFLRTPDALVTLQEIGNRVKEKKGIEVVKKSSRIGVRK